MKRAKKKKCYCSPTVCDHTGWGGAGEEGGGGNREEPSDSVPQGADLKGRQRETLPLFKPNFGPRSALFKGI